jgi:hypothetical protein
VIVDVLRTEPPRASSSEPAIDPEEILVHMPGAQPRKFHEVSEIFTENPLKGKDRLTIFGPFSSYTKTERDREREGLWGVVREVMHERQAEVSNGR